MSSSSRNYTRPAILFNISSYPRSIMPTTRSRCVQITPLVSAIDRLLAPSVYPTTLADSPSTSIRFTTRRFVTPRTAKQLQRLRQLPVMPTGTRRLNIRLRATILPTSYLQNTVSNGVATGSTAKTISTLNTVKPAPSCCLRLFALSLLRRDTLCRDHEGIDLL